MKNLLFSLKGRISQKDYSILASIYFLIMIGIQFGMLFFISFDFISKNLDMNHMMNGNNINYINLLFSKVGLLTFILPSVATCLIIYLIFVVMFKRLHDIGYNGWWTMITIIPLISTLFIFVLMFIKGNEYENKYGNIPEEKLT